MASATAEGPGIENVKEAAQAVGSALPNSTTYALIGGAALNLLGSSRVTKDVDIVVLQGKTTETKQKLLMQAPASFTIDRRTRYLRYTRSNLPVDIEILTPPALFQEEFDEATPTVAIGGGTTKILHPALLLNAKCRSILARSTQEQRSSDSQDIKFLLRWFVQAQSFPTASQVPNASQAFVRWFVIYFKGLDDWKNAGYDLRIGQYIF